MALKDLISKIIVEDEFSDAFDELEDRIDDADKKQSSFGKSLGSLSKGLGGVTAATGPAAAAVTAIGGAAATGLAIAGQEAINFGDQTNRAMELFQQQTGAAVDELDDFRGIALDVFEANWGESIEDVAATMATVKNNTGAVGDELEDLTTGALVLRDRFDKDVNESIDAAKVLMDEFGLNNEQAFDFMVAGAQRGLDRNGDLLDSIREYGNLFGDAGFGADQFFSLMESGAEGGVLGTDKIADSIKEFQIRANEGSDEVREAFGAIGLDFEQTAQQVASGDETWASSFDQIITGINGIEDPIARSQAQVAIFGTQAEDLGASFTTGLTTASTSLEDINGSLAAASDSSTDLSTRAGEMWRRFLVGAEPIAQEILPLLNEGLDIGLQFMEQAQPIFAEFADDLSQNLGPAMLLIEDAALRIAEALGFATEDTTGMDLALGLLKGTLDLTVTAIQAGALAAQGIAYWFEQVESRTRSTREAISDLISSVKELDVLDIVDNLAQLTPAGITTNLLGFATGGTVPGPIGQPQLATVHGGETIRTPEQEEALRRGSGGGGDKIVNVYLQGDSGSPATGQRLGRSVQDAIEGMA